MTLRKSIFWLHLAAGLTAGLIVLMMSATGIAIAFESEITGWIDRDVQSVTAAANTPRMTIAELDHAIKAQRPSFKTTTRIVPREKDRAYEYRAGREGTLFVNPYTGAAIEPKSTATRGVLRMLTEWHRWLGMEGDGRNTGKLITGISNLAFLFMCITGVYMWWPRSWSPRAWRPAVWFVGRIKGRARDFNWHNVIGCWSAIVLIVIVTGGVVMSFQWANRLVFSMVGEEPPQQRGPGAQGGPTVKVPTPEAGQARLSLDAVLERAGLQYPNWESISFEGGQGAKGSDSVQPLNVVVLNPAAFQNKGRVQLAIDPYRGDVLSKVGFADRTPGTRARTWLRFLHTGEALGFVGKVIATLASIGSLFLVYTGFALSCRRFFASKPKHVGVVATTATEPA